MAEVAREVEAGLKARMDATRRFIDDQLSAFRDALDKAIKLMPVQAAAGLLGDTVGNVTALLAKQAEITRRWVKR